MTSRKHSNKKVKNFKSKKNNSKRKRRNNSKRKRRIKKKLNLQRGGVIISPSVQINVRIPSTNEPVQLLKVFGSVIKLEFFFKNMTAMLSSSSPNAG